jgi:hypothetical protein
MFEGGLSELIDDRPQEGVFRISRAIFDDPEIFALAAGDALVEPGSAGINNPLLRL